MTLQVKIDVVDGASRKDAMALLSDFDVYEETHFIGQESVVAFLKAAVGPLEKLLAFLQSNREARIVKSVRIEAGPNRVIEIEGLDIRAHQDVSALATSLLRELDGTGDTT